MKEKIVNYGNVLEKEIKSKGYSKKNIAKLLGISYNTLMDRLRDGKFSNSDLKKLQEQRYIP